MWQNLVWATGYNIIAVPLAAGVQLLAVAGSRRVSVKLALGIIG